MTPHEENLQQYILQGQYKDFTETIKPDDYNKDSTVRMLFKALESDSPNFFFDRRAFKSNSPKCFFDRKEIMIRREIIKIYLKKQILAHILDQYASIDKISTQSVLFLNEFKKSYVFEHINSFLDEENNSLLHLAVKQQRTRMIAFLLEQEDRIIFPLLEQKNIHGQHIVDLAMNLEILSPEMKALLSTLKVKTLLLPEFESIKKFIDRKVEFNPFKGGSLDLNSKLKDFSNEQQYVIINYVIAKFPNLQHLSLGRNNLKILPSEIGNLRNLKELYLHCNQLSTLPAEIGKLRTLKKLYLTINPLTALPVSLSFLSDELELDLCNINRNLKFPPIAVFSGSVSFMKFKEALKPFFKTILEEHIPSLSEIKNVSTVVNLACINKALYQYTTGNPFILKSKFEKHSPIESSPNEIISQTKTEFTIDLLPNELMKYIVDSATGMSLAQRQRSLEFIQSLPKAMERSTKLQTYVKNTADSDWCERIQKNYENSLSPKGLPS